jgi:hypothetical protein
VKVGNASATSSADDATATATGNIKFDAIN